MPNKHYSRHGGKVKKTLSYYRCGMKFESKHGRPSVCEKPKGHRTGHAGSPLK